MKNSLKEKWDDLLDGMEYKIILKPLNEEEVLLFEKNNEISLPEDYRYFVTNVANEITIKCGVFEFIIKGIECPIEKNINKRLKLEFPFDKHYFLYEKKLNSESDLAKDICKKCNKLDECNDASPSLFEKDNTTNMANEDIPYYNGSLLILDMGFEDQYRLVLNGPHKGEIWLNYWETEFEPVTKTFYDFLLAYKTKDKVLTDKFGGVVWNFDKK